MGDPLDGYGGRPRPATLLLVVQVLLAVSRGESLVRVHGDHERSLTAAMAARSCLEQLELDGAIPRGFCRSEVDHD